MGVKGMEKRDMKNRDQIKNVKDMTSDVITLFFKKNRIK